MSSLHHEKEGNYGCEKSERKQNIIEVDLLYTYKLYNSLIGSPTKFVFNEEIFKHDQVTSFLMQVRDDRLRLSAMGLFDVGAHLLPTVRTNQTTYINFTLSHHFILCIFSWREQWWPISLSCFNNSNETMSTSSTNKYLLKYSSRTE